MSAGFSFGQSDVVVTMTPEKPRPGLKPMVRKAYARFGKLKERTVQELCQAVGGNCVYIEIACRACVHTIPVPSWTRAEDVGLGDRGALAYVADALHTAMMLQAAASGVSVVAYGSDRVRWTLSFANERQSAARDVMDAEPDSAGAPVRPCSAGVNGMKEEF